MKEIKGVRELQKIEVGILQYIHEVCCENHLRYTLAYGTLLGAVRHQGFIPWDDDIDILMPREDYKKLCAILARENGRYKMLNSEQDKNYMYSFGKVVDSRTLLVEQDASKPYELGVYVDVFPMDGYVGVQGENDKFLNKCIFLEKCRVFSILPFKHTGHDVWWKNALRWPLWILLRIIGYQNLVKRQNKLIQRYSVDEADWIGCLCSSSGHKELIPKEMMDKPMEISFEGNQFLTVEGCEYMLEKIFGDYMQLPPEDKRVTNHHYKAWWVDEEEGL